MRVSYDDTIPLPKMIKDAAYIRAFLMAQGRPTLRGIWKCNDKIIDENINLFKQYDLYHNRTKAIYAYDGLQYKNIDIDTLDDASIEYLDNNLRIISAMYGVLKPSDGIIPYRLELQAKCNIGTYTSMYEYWGRRIYDEITPNEDLIINLCSKEYSEVIERYKDSNIKIITINFYSLVDGKLKVKGTLAKMLRGRLVRYMAINKITTADELKGFNELGFEYSEENSTNDTMNFINALA